MNKYMKEEKIKCLQEQIVKLQEQIEELNKPDTAYIVVVNHLPNNWYCTGEVYKVFTEPHDDDGAAYYPLVEEKYTGININHCVFITDLEAIEALETSEIKNRK